MNPLQKNKVDIKSLSPEEQRLFRLYGKLPSRSDHLAKHLKERKYFDSGDYALSKAGKSDSVDAGAVGSEHPVPENIPHLTSPMSQQQHHSSSISGVSGAAAVAAGQGQAPHGLKVAGLPHPGVQAGSPVKESSFLNRETNAEDLEREEAEGQQAKAPVSLPVRR